MIGKKVKTFLKLWPYFWPKDLPDARSRLAIALSALTISKISVLFIPLTFKYAVDVLTDQSSSNYALWSLIIGYGLIRLATALFTEIREATFAKVAQRALRQIGIKIFNHLHNLSIRFHLERQTGGLTRIIERGTKAIETLVNFLSLIILPTIIEILLVSILVGVMYDKYFALIIFITMAAYIGFTLKMTEWRVHYVRHMNSSENEAQTKAIDSLLNFETVKYFQNEKYEEKYFDDSLQLYEKAAIKSKISLSYLNIGQSIIINVGLIFVMVLTVLRIKQNLMTVGDLVAVNAFLIQLYIPLSNLGFAYREIKLALVNLESMFELLHEIPEVQDTVNAHPLELKKGEVVFDNVCFSYHPERLILKNVSFIIPAGHTLAVVGPSGSGKSTLSRLLFRFYDVKEGSIKIDGQDIRLVKQESLRHNIGIVPQDIVLFNDTIFYNIAYGKPNASKEEIIQAAKQAYIHDFIMSLPSGYETTVGERGLKLSGGEKQRVAVARTLLKKPAIFVFDEATSALDTHAEKQIQENIRSISKNHTTLIIAHRLSTIIDAHTIVFLENGYIIEKGTHEGLLEKNGAYARMWKRQQEKQNIEV